MIKYKGVIKRYIVRCVVISMYSDLEVSNFIYLCTREQRIKKESWLSQLQRVFLDRNGNITSGNTYFLFKFQSNCNYYLFEQLVT